MKKVRILAVDDNVVNLRSLVQELKDKYEVIPVSSGNRAVRYLQKETADLILLDVQMPDMDGIETLQVIRERSKGVMIPVIFLTSSNDRTTVLEGMKLGIMDYIVKPFQRDDLLGRIDRTLKKQGVIPVERWELYESISDLGDMIHDGQWKQATAKAKEIAGYQISEEVAGRVRTIAQKLESGDYKTAEQTVDRVIQLMDSQTAAADASHEITQLEVSVKMNNVLDDLDKFRTQEAMDKMNDLLTYELPSEQRKCCEQVLACIRDYDDAEAEKLLLQMLDDATKSF